VAKSVGDIETEMRANPGGIRFAAAAKVAKHYFGPPRKQGSHWVYKMPWPLDPRVNLQVAKDGHAKPYQVRQLISAIDRLKAIATVSDTDE